ncbi:MAG: DUF4399 domain-containing protein [Flammeovirgaceae bacterium]
MKNLAFIVISLFFLSCNNKKSVENKEVIIEEKVSKRVFFKWPKNGSTVASPVFIDMGVEGMEIEPAGLVKEGFGHHHILINQKFWPKGQVIPTSDSTLHYGKGQTDASIELDPGKYVISLQFADGVHVSFGEEMSESIEINVE